MSHSRNRSASGIQPLPIDIIFAPYSTGSPKPNPDQRVALKMPPAPPLPPTDKPLGGLSDIILQFIDTATLTTAYAQRSHPHTSLLNAYIVAIFLQGSIVENISPLKRNAGLRDLAQKLHTWPGDINRDMRRDALKAIDLLHEYIKQCLAAEMRYVENISAQGPDTPVGKKEIQIPRMVMLKHQAETTLEDLIRKTREQIQKPDWEAAVGGLELNDLAPFIPFFDTAKEVMNEHEEESEMLDKGKKSAKGVQEVGLNKARAEAFQAVENYRHQVNVATEEILGLLHDNSAKSWKSLQKNVGKIPAIYAAHEMMAIKLAELLRAESGKDVD